MLYLRQIILRTYRPIHNQPKKVAIRDERTSEMTILHISPHTLMRINTTGKKSTLQQRRKQRLCFR